MGLYGLIRETDILPLTEGQRAKLTGDYLDLINLYGVTSKEATDYYNGIKRDYPSMREFLDATRQLKVMFASGYVK